MMNAYKINLTDDQRVQLVQLAGAYRFTFNKTLAAEAEGAMSIDAAISNFDSMTEECPFLLALPRYTVEATINALYDDISSNGGLPRYVTKKAANAIIPIDAASISLNGNTAIIAGIGEFNVELSGTTLSHQAAISQDKHEWYILA